MRAEAGSFTFEDAPHQNIIAGPPLWQGLGPQTEASAAEVNIHD